MTWAKSLSEKSKRQKQGKNSFKRIVGFFLGNEYLRVLLSDVALDKYLYLQNRHQCFQLNKQGLATRLFLE